MANLRSLWSSTESLHRRFDVYPPDSNRQMDYVYLELSEFSAEVFRHKNPPSTAAEELVDVIVTLFGVAMGHSVAYSDIENAMQRVIDKNNAKTDVTHVVMDNQIIRRDKVK